MNIVIVEDEPAAARLLRKMIAKVEGLSTAPVDICHTLEEAEKRLEEPVDLLFLDLNLAGRSGFDLLEVFSAESFETIITTADAASAVRAFEIGVTDYLLKPFSQKRLEQALARVGREREEGGAWLKKIMIKERGRIVSIPVDTLLVIRSAGDYTELVSEEGERKLCAKSLDWLEKRLPEGFARVHRQAIVRITRATELNVEAGGKYAIIIEGVDEPVPVGRKYYRATKKLFTG